MTDTETSAQVAADLAGEAPATEQSGFETGVPSDGQAAPVGESDGPAATSSAETTDASDTGSAPAGDASAAMSAAQDELEATGNQQGGTLVADPAHQMGAYRVMWIDHGGAPQTYEHSDAEFVKGLAIGLLRDGRNRDIVMVDDDAVETVRVMTEEEALAF